MTAKKDTQFSNKGCSCMEMMSQTRDQKEAVDPCSEMMSHFPGRQEVGNKLSEMMAQVFASCCGIQTESDRTTKKV